MDRSYIDQYLLVDRYVQGTLDDSEVAMMEERLAWDEALLNEVELAERLRFGLQQAFDADPAALEPVPPISTVSRMFLVPQYAAAASFFLAAILTSLVWLKLAPDADPAGDGFTSGTSVVRLETTRSDVHEILDIAGNGVTVVLIDAPLDESGRFFESYNVEVTERGDVGRSVFTKAGLVPGYEESLAIAIPDRLLEHGGYVLTVGGLVEKGTYRPIQSVEFEAQPIP